MPSDYNPKEAPRDYNPKEDFLSPRPGCPIDTAEGDGLTEEDIMMIREIYENPPDPEKLLKRLNELPIPHRS